MDILGILDPDLESHENLYGSETLVIISVVDPNTLNLDPDPGFWPHLYQDPGLYYQF